QRAVESRQLITDPLLRLGRGRRWDVLRVLEGDRGGGDVLARVLGTTAVATPLLVVEVERDGRRDGAARGANTRRRLLGRARLEHDRSRACEQDPLRPKARQTGFSNGFEDRHLTLRPRE